VVAGTSAGPFTEPPEPVRLPNGSSIRSFANGQALLQVAEKHGLEGVVSKHRNATYKSGACRGWRKVKTKAWRDANRERWRLFER
jgi:ATP-dependent DNA ligase